MKFKIFQDKKKDKKQYFKLRETISGNRIELVACEQDGHVSTGGCILQLSQKDGIRLYSDVSDELGLPLDSIQRVTVKNKQEA